MVLAFLRQWELLSSSREGRGQPIIFCASFVSTWSFSSVPQCSLKTTHSSEQWLDVRFLPPEVHDELLGVEEQVVNSVLANCSTLSL